MRPASPAVATLQSDCHIQGMLPEDEKRAEREDAVARSVQGPDYSAVKAALQRVHGAIGNADSAAMRAYITDKIGYYLNYSGQKENGRVPVYNRDSPGSRLEKADTEWTR